MSYDKKMRRLKARLEIAQETNRIHVEARRVLTKEARELRETIEQLRTGHSVPPRKTVPGCNRICCNPVPGIAIGHHAFTEHDGEPVVAKHRGSDYPGVWIDETHGLPDNDGRETFDGLVTPGFPSDLPPVYFTTPDGEG